MKEMLGALLLVAAAVAAVGCNTIHGFGKDMERAGEKVQQASRK